MRYLAIALATALTLISTVGFAQPDAGAKARGEYHFYGRGARSAMRGARESVRSYREYVRTVPPQPAQVVQGPPRVVVSPQVTQVAADGIGDYITKSEKHLAWMRKQADSSNDKETLADLDSIDQHLAQAKKNHAELCASCAAENVNATVAMACCQRIDDALAKAIAEHDALMKRLGEAPSEAK